MKRLDLDPFEVLHGRDKPRNALDIRRVAGLARDEGEPDPDRLGQ
jgi:hypothetical protein